MKTRYRVEFTGVGFVHADDTGEAEHQVGALIESAGLEYNNLTAEECPPEGEPEQLGEGR